MRNLKHIQILLFTLLPAVYFAQTGSTAANCPDWSEKRQNNRGNYLEYLRNNQGKKVNHNEPYLASVTTLDTTKDNIGTEQKAPAKNNFYTQKRYKLFPEKADETKIESGKKDEPTANGNTSAEPAIVNRPLQKENSQPQVIEAESNLATVTTTPMAEPPITESNEATTQTQGDGIAKVESRKTHTSKLKKKLSHIFSKKTNKPAKPHYERCTTKF